MRKVGKAINTYGLAGEGDRIAVGFSGGKDSRVLLEALSSRRKRLPIHYDVLAVHVKVNQLSYALDRDRAEEFCRGLGVPLYIMEIDLEFDFPSLETPCHSCARRRRKALFGFMKEQGCTRLALGHHMDDIIETLLMNMAFQANISTMPPKLPLFGGEFDIIRPLALLTADEVERYASIRGLSSITTECPHADATRREDMRRIISDMERLYVNAKHNLFYSMSNIRKEYLPER
jgi:tRNA(Ile)-lysidine synthase TilS/MesJ